MLERPRAIVLDAQPSKLAQAWVVEICIVVREFHLRLKRSLILASMLLAMACSRHAPSATTPQLLYATLPNQHEVA
ncbi:MAG TPA: hypothetical protein VHY56_09800, partial [Candidatus Binataceae bacterium]|nr:hypothetical protein [Candidatus Binataceae bacterium]